MNFSHKEVPYVGNITILRMYARNCPDLTEAGQQIYDLLNLQPKRRQAWKKRVLHTFRHSYQMWTDAVGTPIGVQQKLMRHADIRTTMNIYGDAASADMPEAHGKIVRLALES